MMTRDDFCSLDTHTQRRQIEDAVRAVLRRRIRRPDPLGLALLDVAAATTTIILILDFCMKRGPLRSEDAAAYLAACRDRDLAFAGLRIANPYAPRVH